MTESQNNPEFDRRLKPTADELQWEHRRFLNRLTETMGQYRAAVAAIIHAAEDGHTVTLPEIVALISKPPVDAHHLISDTLNMEGGWWMFTTQQVMDDYISDDPSATEGMACHRLGIDRLSLRSAADDYRNGRRSAIGAVRHWSER